MQKYLRIPVTNEQTQLVGINGIILVEQTSTTTVSISYETSLMSSAGTAPLYGRNIVITHAAIGAGSEAVRDAIQNAIVAALQEPWYNVVYDVLPPVAVSGIAIA
jgi:hypothetical protein